MVFMSFFQINYVGKAYHNVPIGASCAYLFRLFLRNLAFIFVISLHFNAIHEISLPTKNVGIEMTFSFLSYRFRCSISEEISPANTSIPHCHIESPLFGVRYLQKSHCLQKTTFLSAFEMTFQLYFVIFSTWHNGISQTVGTSFIPVFQYSSFPIFQFSSFPIFQYSNFPIFPIFPLFGVRYLKQSHCPSKQHFSLRSKWHSLFVIFLMKW